jgi:hypothetical protein
MPASAAPAVVPFEIISDTREKNGWQFRKSAKCSGMVTRMLKTGDYSITGLDDPSGPHSVTIERKGSISEFVGNLSKSDFPRFERELVRMKEFERAFVVLEFTMADLMKWPASSGVGGWKRRRIQTTGAYILKVFLQVQARHPHVHFVFAGSDGQAVALAILKQAWADYGPASLEPQPA